jgi:hypothetical protein
VVEDEGVIKVRRLWWDLGVLVSADCLTVQHDLSISDLLAQLLGIHQ